MKGERHRSYLEQLVHGRSRRRFAEKAYSMIVPAIRIIETNVRALLSVTVHQLHHDVAKVPNVLWRIHDRAVLLVTLLYTLVWRYALGTGLTYGA